MGGHGGNRALGPRVEAASLRMAFTVMYNYISTLTIWNCRRDGNLDDVGFSYTLTPQESKIYPQFGKNMWEKKFSVGCDKNKEHVKSLVLDHEDYISQLWVSHRVKRKSCRVTKLKFIFYHHEEIATHSNQPARHVLVSTPPKDADFEKDEKYLDCMKKMEI